MLVNIALNPHDHLDWWQNISLSLYCQHKVSHRKLLNFSTGVCEHNTMIRIVKEPLERWEIGLEI